jgi:hypothetical protein
MQWAFVVFSIFRVSLFVDLLFNLSIEVSGSIDTVITCFDISNGCRCKTQNKTK